jgi:casein kinase II subunit beta|tara:strand:+ start:974 stop:1315 length:342 start_codon:yes stop_codon:yes gene_type:complete
MELMKQKIMKGDIGCCPRVLCHKQTVIPYGESVNPEENSENETMVYCPKCKGLFKPDYLKHQKLNGAHFGPYFAGILILCYPKIVVNPKKEIHVHKIYGFKIHEESPLHPQQL